MMGKFLSIVGVAAVLFGAIFGLMGRTASAFLK